ERDHIHLHLEHLGPAVIHERLPGIAETSRIFAGVDVTRQPIPVQPTVHYNMGGIPCNYHGEVIAPRNGDPDSVVPGLMAVGETACVSVHGANRLGSNSLLDLVVFGRQAARRCAELIAPGTRHAPLAKDAADPALARLERLRNAHGSRPTAEIRLEMQKTMQRDAAVFRTQQSLEEGARKLARTYESLADVRVDRPLAGVEYRSDRDDGAREPAHAGHRHGPLGPQPHREPRRARARGLPRTAMISTG
ncbi:succinate dehydrogenase flavoprotein subunit, partial [mine drainage metagenome]